MSLKKKTLSGLFWSFSQQFGVQLINFIVQIVLARILLPAEFGLIGMLTIFISVGNSLMDSGLTSSLIRTPNPDQRDYSTVFFINVIGSIVIYALLFVAAPFIAAFFRQPVLTSIVRVYTLSFILRAFVGVQTTRLSKEMNFKIQMLMQIPSVVAGGILGIILAYLGYGVWSLVWMNLTQAFLFTIQHWFRTGWYPDFIIDKERLKYHFKFGYKLALSTMLSGIYVNIYNLIIGKYFTASQLGFYTRAQTLQMFPVQNLSNALHKVTYPMFASIQYDDRKLKSAYKKIMQQVIYWVAPLMILLAIIAEPLFRFLLSEKWLPAVPYFQILCFSGLLYPLQFYNLNILNVKGRSDLYFKLEMLKKGITTVGVFCVFPLGIYGLLYFQVASAVLFFFINTLYSGKLINYPVKEQFQDISSVVLLAFVVGAICWVFNRVLTRYVGINDISHITIISCLYLLIYLGSSYCMRVSALLDFRQLVLRR